MAGLARVEAQEEGSGVVVETAAGETVGGKVEEMEAETAVEMGAAARVIARAAAARGGNSVEVAPLAAEERLAKQAATVDGAAAVG